MFAFDCSLFFFFFYVAFLCNLPRREERKNIFNVSRFKSCKNFLSVEHALLESHFQFKGIWGNLAIQVEQIKVLRKTCTGFLSKSRCSTVFREHMRSLPNVHGKWQIKETGQQKKYPFDNNLWLEESSY